MITLIEAKHFRCLRYIRQPLGSFHVLVGPNASGKSTFLDIIAFLGKLVSAGPDVAVSDRAANFQDLVWMRANKGFELTIEAQFPEELRPLLRQPDFDTVRYEVALAMDNVDNQVTVSAEKLLLKVSASADNRQTPRQRALFPRESVAPDTIVTASRKRKTQMVVNKVRGGNDNFYSEVYQQKGKGWAPSFKLGPRKSALGHLPADEKNFPVATWFKALLTAGVHRFVPDGSLIRKTSPPGQGWKLKPDGANLPWALLHLQENHPERYLSWIAHLKTALPDLVDIETIERQDDRHRYLLLEFKNGLKTASWLASNGTMRLLALTLPAYLPDAGGVYLIENPENGIHPQAIGAMFQSLSSVNDAQILLTTHSPAVLSRIEAEKAFCFAQTLRGETDIVIGAKHPALRASTGKTHLEVLFSAAP